MQSKRMTMAVGSLLATAALLVGCSGGSNLPSDGGQDGGSADRPSWCGETEALVALADAFGGNSWKQLNAAEAEDEARLCPAVTDFIYTDAQGDTQKAIADIRSLTAQGVNALVIFPDGEVQLPAIREAFEADVSVVPYRVPLGGEEGVDYVKYISTDNKEVGLLWGEWLAEHLDGVGNVVFLGGPAANAQSTERAEGLKEVLAEHPDMHLVGGDPFAVTNWDPAETQRVMSALLAQYPEIDAVVADFSPASAIAAYQQAGRPLPLFATQDENGFACDFETLKAANPDYDVLTVDGQTWMVRLAVQWAVAEATGGTPPTDDSVPNLIFEDSITGDPNSMMCDPELPKTALLSAHLEPEQIAEALR